MLVNAHARKKILDWDCFRLWPSGFTIQQRRGWQEFQRTFFCCCHFCSDMSGMIRYKIQREIKKNIYKACILLSRRFSSFNVFTLLNLGSSTCQRMPNMSFLSFKISVLSGCHDGFDEDFDSNTFRNFLEDTCCKFGFSSGQNQNILFVWPFSLQVKIADWTNWWCHPLWYALVTFCYTHSNCAGQSCLIWSLWSK